MRRMVLITAAAAAIVTAGAFAPSSAKAMPLTGPAALAAALPNESLAERVAYDCRPVWRCGYYGCGWRRLCAWTPGVRYYGYGYFPHRRPYWAWRWRHHYW
jgi:hypothetical protein